jgi:large subunit ribosomal protein L9
LQIYPYQGRKSGMKVVMLQDVKGVGQRGKVVDVSDGYALNMLIPNGKAVQATPQKEEEVKKKLAAEEQASAQKGERTRETLREIDGKQIVIKAKGNDRGHLYKKVDQHNVLVALGELTTGVAQSITPDMIKGIDKGLKEAGEFVVEIAGAGAKAAVKVVIEAIN